MTYLPARFINSNYTYYVTNDYIEVHTRDNCYTNYNNEYCDTYRIYPNNDYLVSKPLSSTLSYSSTYSIDYSAFSSDIWYRQDLDKILFIFLILSIVIIVIPFKLMSRVFGRWLKI